MTSDFWKNYINSALCPNFLKGENGKAFLDSIGEEKDALEADLIATIEASMPNRCDSSMLPILAKDRNVFVAPGESSTQLRARLTSYRQDKQLGGTDNGVINCVANYLNIKGIKSPLGCDTIIIKSQRDFTPSWDFERLFNKPLPAYLTKIPDSLQYKITDIQASKYLNSSGYLGYLEVRKRFAYGFASMPGDDYVYFINSSNCLKYVKSLNKFQLSINGYTILSNLCDFAANELLTFKIYHDSSQLTFIDRNGYYSGTIQGSITNGNMTLYNPTYVGTLYPSPDPSLGWSTQWIILDGTSLNVDPVLLGEGTSGMYWSSHALNGVNTINGNSYSQEDYDALRKYIRSVKGSHCYIPNLFIWLRNWGLESYNEQALPTLQSFSANALDKCLVMDIGEI